MPSPDHHVPQPANTGWISNLRIGQRLALGNVLPVLLFSVFAVWLWWSVGSVRQDVEVNLTAQVTMALQAREMERDVVQVQQWLSDISATRALDGLDDGFTEAEKSRANFLSGLQQFEAYAQAHPQQLSPSSLTRLRTDFEAYYAAGVGMAQAYVTGGPDKGNPLMGPFDTTSAALQVDMQALVAVATNQLQAEVTGVASQAQWLRQIGVLLCLAVLAILLLTGWRIAHSIVHPLQGAMQALKRVAEGDLAFHVPVAGKDEIAELMLSLRHMQEQLRGICLGVRANAEQVAAASQQIATGNQDLSSRTEQQASALQQTSSAMDQLDCDVGQSAQSAAQANMLANDASVIATRTGGVVQEMVQTMQGINESSHKIGDIIGVIDSIAFQTNILALNAAVEAARAGEQGRGFAVVASEVRSLAGRSAEAAKEIKALITDSVQRVESGATLVQQAGSSIEAVVTSIQKVNAIMGKITQATEHEHASIAQVAVAVRQMDASTQQNAALVEESAAAAHALSDQAQHLLELTSVFNLGTPAVPRLHIPGPVG